MACLLAAGKASSTLQRDKFLNIDFSTLGRYPDLLKVNPTEILTNKAKRTSENIEQDAKRTLMLQGHYTNNRLSDNDQPS